MLSIFICEDEPQLLSLYEDAIRNYLLFHDCSMEITCVTGNTDDIMTAVRKGHNKGIYFLDIDLGTGREGIELGKAIRELDPDGYIIFISSHSELSLTILEYQITATDFIAKDTPDQIKARIAHSLDTIHEREFHPAQSSEILKIKEGRQIIRLYQEDIYYITKVPGTHKMLIYTKNGIHEVRGSIKELEPDLAPYMLHCHSSIIVNKNHIRSIDNKNHRIELNAGYTCDISVRYLKKIQQSI